MFLYRSIFIVRLPKNRSTIMWKETASQTPKFTVCKLINQKYEDFYYSSGYPSTVAIEVKHETMLYENKI